MSRTKGSSSPTRGKPKAIRTTPTREEIALRAYEIYLERGATPGHELEDWTRAERELIEKNGKPQSKTQTSPVAA